MINAVIFDLDGVLIESEPLYIEVEKDVLKPYGIELTDEVAAQYMGIGLNNYLKILADKYGKAIDIDKASSIILSKIDSLYDTGSIPLTPGAIEVLEELSRSYKLALATGREKSLATKIMNKHGVDTYFQGGVYIDDVTKSKPDPEVFLKAAEKIGVSPKNCLVVEDSINGMRAGKAAGMYVVARKTSYNQSQDLSVANSVIVDLKELPSIVNNLKS